jgi:hypothetical protein
MTVVTSSRGAIPRGRRLLAVAFRLFHGEHLQPAQLAAVDLHPILFHVPRPGFRGQIQPRTDKLGLGVSKHPGGMWAAQDHLIAACRQQLRFVDAQPGQQREQQLGVVLKVFDTDDHIHPRSANPGVNLREIESFVPPPRFRLQLVPGLLKLQHRKLTRYMRDA